MFQNLSIKNKKKNWKIEKISYIFFLKKKQKKIRHVKLIKKFLNFNKKSKNPIDKNWKTKFFKNFLDKKF